MANLGAVIKCWTEFNLSGLQKTLDESATETAARQDASEKAKRKLIEQMKSWKKNNDEEVRTKAAPIIKAFQKEIDSLNKRSKAAESSFLMVYKALLEIPDPVPALKQAEATKKQLDKCRDIEMENDNLRKTLDEYHAEFAEVKNQEVTIKELREKLKEYEGNKEASIQEQMEVREFEMQKKFAEIESELHESQIMIASQLGESEQKVKDLVEDLKEADERLEEQASRFDEETSARLSEIEMLENDLERATQALHASERLVEQISHTKQNQIELGGGQTNLQQFSEENKALEAQLLSKENELAQLLEEVHHLQSVSQKAKDQSEKEISLLERNLEDKTQLIARMEQQLKAQTDYEDVKRELRILKMIEFSVSEEDERQYSGVKTLEKLLLEKNKTLQTECTTLKVQNNELTVKYEESSRKQTESAHKIREQDELIVQLEGDLSAVQGIPLVRGEGVGQAAPPTSETELMQKAIQDIAKEEGISTMDQNSMDSLLPIVTSQRERFRTRNLELESQTRHQQRQINLLQDEVDTVRQDNVKLYGKIKFLQSYPTSQAASSSGEVGDDSLSKYHSSYEEKMDPFNVFSRKERQRKYGNLSGPEKVTLGMARFILSNKIARTLVFFYTIIMHCLVFIVLYNFGHTEHCNAQIADALNQHNLQHHVDNAVSAAQQSAAKLAGMAKQ